MANETEKLGILQWVSKAIIAINWFSGGVQASIVVTEHINEWKYNKQTSYSMYLKNSEHTLKS